MRNKWLIIWLASVVLLVLSAGVIYWQLQRPRLATVISVADVSNQRDELFKLTNQARLNEKITPLSRNAKLDLAAQSKANDMIAHGYWGHTSPDDKTPWDWLNVANYDYKTAAENLAYGFSSNQKVIAGWLTSKDHRANLLGGYSEVGFGMATGEHYLGGRNTVVVALYASPH